jgi:hypothetical protein
MALFLLIFGSMLIAPVSAQSYREEGIRIGSGALQDAKGISIGKATLKAMISQTGQYDSNVFLTSEGEKHDYISITSPELLLNVPMGIDERHLFQLMYRADAAAFSDNTSQNYLNQNAAANANMRLPWGYWNIQEDFKDTVDRSATEFTTQVRRQENRAQTTVGVEINKLTYELGYSNFLKRFHDSDFEGLDYNEDVFSGTVFYQLFPKTKALVEYDHGEVDYTEESATRDGSYDQFLAGLKGEITGKTVGIVKLGYQSREYDLAGRKGYEGLIAETGLITTFSERTELALRFLRNAVESTYGNNSYYNANLFSAVLTQKLMDHFSLQASSVASRNLYPEEVDGEKRNDTILTEGLTLGYDIKDGARVSLGYTYNQDISNIDSSDYTDNLVSLRFDFLL